MRRFLYLSLIICIAASAVGCVFVMEEAPDMTKTSYFAETETEDIAKALTLDAFNEKICYGQGHETDGKNRPTAAVTAQEKYGALGGLFIGGENDKTVYLTFDEGYENNLTGQILDTLKSKNVTATFYVTLDYAKSNPQLIRRMINEGHSVGNHTCTHPSLPDLSDEEVFEELKGLHSYIEKNFNGYKMTSVRPPNGEFSARTITVANNFGYKTVLWSFAYADWDVNAQPDKAEAFERITQATHNGAVYLLHAVSKTNAEILGDVIDYWLENGYEVKSI